ARLDGRQRRRETGSAGDAGHHHVGWLVGRREQSFAACRRPRTGAGQRVAQFAMPLAVGDHCELGLELARERHQSRDVTLRRDGRHREGAVGAAQEVEGALADRTRCPQHRDPHHHDNSPAAGACTPPAIKPMMSATSAPNRKPSSRSITPPWPGNSVLASFTAKRRLIADSKRSPNCAATMTRNAAAVCIGCQATPPANRTSWLATRPASVPPIAPDHVFFGLIDGASLGPPKARPAKYA